MCIFSHTSRTLVLSGFVSLLLSVVLFAQDPTKRYQIRGEVTLEDDTQPQGLMVEVIDIGGHSPVERVGLSFNGAFEVSNLANPNVELRVVDEAGNILRRDQFFLTQQLTAITLRLTAIPKKSKPITGAVSAHRLRHKPSARAVKEFKKAEQRFNKGDVDGSLKHLEAAVEADPEFVEALNNLGSRLIQTGHPLRALEILRQAQSLDSESAPTLINLGIVLLQLKRPAEAEEAARHAVRLPHENNSAEYILGMSLSEQHKELGQALRYLRMATPHFPKAHLQAANILTRAGRVDEAKVELKSYLSASNENKEAVEKWMKSLR